MNAEVKARWIKALRSGRYSQVAGVLHNEEGYCCLGVLCRVDGRRFLPVSGGFQIFDKVIRVWRESMPPTDLLEKAQLSKPKAEKLADMNDKGKTFSQIADWIEKNL